MILKIMSHSLEVKQFFDTSDSRRRIKALQALDFPYTGDCQESDAAKKPASKSSAHLTKARLHVGSQNLPSIRCKDRDDRRRDAHLNPLVAQSSPAAQRSPNDVIQFALIGAGIQGQGDTRTALQVPGVKLVAVADCYDGRLAHAKSCGAPISSPPATTARFSPARTLTPSSSPRPTTGTSRPQSTR